MKVQTSKENENEKKIKLFEKKMWKIIKGSGGSWPGRGHAHRLPRNNNNNNNNNNKEDVGVADAVDTMARLEWPMGGGGVERRRDPKQQKKKQREKKRWSNTNSLLFFNPSTHKIKREK